MQKGIGASYCWGSWCLVRISGVKEDPKNFQRTWRNKVICKDSRLANGFGLGCLTREQCPQNSEGKSFSTYNVIPNKTTNKMWRQNKIIFRHTKFQKFISHKPFPKDVTGGWAILKQENKPRKRKTRDPRNRGATYRRIKGWPRATAAQKAKLTKSSWFEQNYGRLQKGLGVG